MNTTKMTYVYAVNYAIDVLGEDEHSYDVVQKLIALREQLEKRNTSERKPTKAQKLNADLAEVVAEVLANASEPMTITEILQSDERLSALSNQKVTAVVRSMGARVEKVADKRVNRFRLA